MYRGMYRSMVCISEIFMEPFCVRSVEVIDHAWQSSEYGEAMSDLTSSGGTFRSMDSTQLPGDPFIFSSVSSSIRKTVEQFFVIIGTVKGQSKTPFCSAMLSFLAV